MYVLSLGLNQRRQPDSTLPFRWMEILGGFNLDILVAGLLLLPATLSANARERPSSRNPTPILSKVGFTCKVIRYVVFLIYHTPEVLALKHERGILGQRSNSVSVSRKSQDSSPWAKQHRV